MSSKHVLVVDDDPNILELLDVNLSAAGYAVTRAADGREGLRQAQALHPDLVLLDVTMPEMDGWELCKTLKDDPELAGTKVLILTARASDRDRMIAVGILKADAYIAKPFDTGELLTLVGRLAHD